MAQLYIRKHASTVQIDNERALDQHAEWHFPNPGERVYEALMATLS